MTDLRWDLVDTTCGRRAAMMGWNGKKLENYILNTLVDCRNTVHAFIFNWLV